jgi:hypothetical protein
MKTASNSIRFLIFPILLFFVFSYAANAQLSQGGVPRSFSHSMVPDSKHAVVIEAPDLLTLQQEDERMPLPYRFAVNIPVDIDPAHDGAWDQTPDGLPMWRLTIIAREALALSLYFDRFTLPEGGRLFVYNPGRTRLLGAFAGDDRSASHGFATGLIPGEEITIEYNSDGTDAMPDFHISEVAWAYRGVGAENEDGFGGSGNCEVNINCPEGLLMQTEKRGVARIQVKRGTGTFWCSGSLVNNTRFDKIPYLLTADHCGRNTTAVDLEQWIFYFNYESATCADPSFEPVAHAMTGASLVSHGGDAGNSGSDFFLVRLNENIPDSFHVCFNGWSRENEASPHGTGIHHPQGDIQKISTYTEPLVSSSWNGHVPGSHWRVVWDGTPNGHGVTEGGSSGSPIFDELGRIVGTLTGGDSSCDTVNLDAPDYYGKFSYHWDQNGSDSSSVLSVWLDPDNSGVMTVDPLYVSVGETQQTNWFTAYPNPAEDVLLVEISGESPATITLIDGQGRTCHESFRKVAQGETWRIGMAGFSPGIYFLKVNGATRQSVTKIIKQK